MNKGNTFRVIFKYNYFEKGEVLTVGNCGKVKVLQKPYKKWYRRLLYFITFGLYKAPWGYKVKLIKND